MKNFRTQYDKQVPIYEHTGSPVKTLYAPVFSQEGVMDLKEIGKHDLYQEIQSHRDSVDIHVLLSMYNNGDPGALSRIQGAYGDFTKMPTTFAEALNTMIAAEQYFNGLPVDVRAKFGHDFHQFIATMDTPDWTTRMGLDQPGKDGLFNEPSTAPGAVSTPSEPAPATPTPATPVSPAEATVVAPAAPA